MDSRDVFTEILKNNIRREARTLSEFACKSSQGIRKNAQAEEVPDKENIRPIFFHDTDRIIHSLAYSRYIDKTQVFYLFENDHITHRVLHVQFVSKIGRVIGRCLRLNEDLIEAISLGHDIGHVPYGHDGEKVLNEICEENKIGGFCHNVQSVRFLREIEKNGNGLNLSLQVLDGILAHNGEVVSRIYCPNYGKSWNDFEVEYRECFTTRDRSKSILPMTLEGCVVRISDIIAYVGRDIEDAILLNLIQRGSIPSAIRKRLGDNNRRVINNLVIDLIENSYGKDHLEFSQNIYKALIDLKEFNEEMIYINKRIKTESHKIKRMFDMLFRKYCDDFVGKQKESSIYTYFLNDMECAYTQRTDAKRIAVDFIAGMTDDFFTNQFTRAFVPQSYGYSLAKESWGKAVSPV